jgi:phage terminase large subunit-like protein
VRDVLKGAAFARDNWLIVPEGNGKTTGTAELALYGADFCWRPWIPVGASTRDQAMTLYTQAAGFVRDTPGLGWDKDRGGGRFRCLDGHRKIRSLRTGGVGIEICPWNPGSNDGKIPWPFFIVDEPHRHPDMSLWRLWHGKLRKRGGQGIGISTAGEPGSEFEDTRDRVREGASARRRRGGCVRYTGKRVVMHEYMLERAEDCRDPRKVKRVNPLSTITVEMLAEDLASDTFDLGDFMRLKCDVPARSSAAAVSTEGWDLKRHPELRDVPEGEPCDYGLDVAWTWDTTAFEQLWRGDDLLLLGPATVLTPPGDGNDLAIDEVKVAFERLHARNPARVIVMDTSDAKDLAQWFRDEHGVEVVDRGQTNPHHVLDFNNFTRCLRAQRESVDEEGLRTVPLWHTGDPVLRRHVMNAVVRVLPGEQKRFDRPSTTRRNQRKQDVRVVDALTASGMVVTYALADTGPLRPLVAVRGR